MENTLEIPLAFFHSLSATLYTTLPNNNGSHKSLPRPRSQLHYFLLLPHITLSIIIMSSKIEKAGRVQQISDEEWGKMKEMITEQLDSVSSDLSTLRENGSLETIAQMIQRGDRCPSARIQAWYVSGVFNIFRTYFFIAIAHILCSFINNTGIMQCSKLNS